MALGLIAPQWGELLQRMRRPPKVSVMIGVGLSGMTLMNQDRTSQQASSLIGKIFSVKGRNQSKEIEVSYSTSSEGQYDLPLEPLLSRGVSTKVPSENLSFRVFVATWNVGGKSPDSKLNLDDVLQVREESDIYVLGKVSKAFRTESKKRLKSCNCPVDLERKNSKDFCFRCPQSQTNENDFSSEEDEDGSSSFAVNTISNPSGTNQMKYSLVAMSFDPNYREPGERVNVRQDPTQENKSKQMHDLQIR
ncbi:type I inositol 1,4,5-trisphosphate 5-phosphatase CVP2-like protein [Corchorus olitorius]|uniref:Type I inositol 1,4,5-trisphosphate 5-phosphatase CVP2-like protein n=1 Tax=Corchorus olitorius TaxID=93759 RepID=A0A1R3KS33_9ROSI|nr:type I inositol 1,4,5-trisphosphate 5-phosphatase CVP2-like protein [Corchorus olitorius]